MHVYHLMHINFEIIYITNTDFTSGKLL